MIYLEFSRYCAAVAELLRKSEDNIVPFLEKCEAIASVIRRRIDIPKVARIPWATKIDGPELVRWRQLCDWVDSQLGFNLCRHPQASVLSVSTMLATLLGKIPTAYNKITLLHFQYMDKLTGLNRRLLAYNIEDGLATSNPSALFPIDLDEKLAGIIDDFHSQGIRLGD